MKKNISEIHDLCKYEHYIINSKNNWEKIQNKKYTICEIEICFGEKEYFSEVMKDMYEHKKKNNIK